MTAETACEVFQADYRGWAAYYLQNGLIRLVAVPAIGGRIMAYDLGPYPFLFVDRDLAGRLFTPEEHQGDGSLAAWKNYGGDKTWPSPQGWDNEQQWPGPPDPVLDSGRYSVEAFEASADRATIRMVSPPDPHTGVQISRQATIRRGSSRVTLELTFRNVKDRPIRWSIWDVVQLRAERALPDGGLTHEPACMITAPLNPHSRFPHGFNVMFGDTDNPQWQADHVAGLFRAPYQWQIGKVGLDSPAGWIAFSNATAGYAFAEQFTYDPAGDYPDDGATVEVWTVGAGEVGNLDYEGSDIYLMEAEVLSPFRTIPPGGTTGFALAWGSCRADGPVVAVTEAGCLTAPLAVEALPDGYAQVTLRGGVFDAGELRVAWLDEQGGLLGEIALGAVDPLAALAIDRVMRPPEGARRLALRVIPAGGDQPVLLAEAEV